MTRPTRFRLFYWLLDAATLATLFTIGSYVARPGLLLSEQPDNLLTRIVGVLAVLLPAILIFVRAIRDEYAEQLWQAAAGATLRGLIWVPYAAFFLWGFIEEIADLPNSDPDALISGTQMLALVLVLQLTIFVLTLQWHRWKATRG